MTRHSNSQRGGALITGLIMLVALTMLGITALQSASLEERMSGNSRDRNLALQAAEAALRDAERDILSRRADGTDCTPGAAGCRPAWARPYDAAGMTGWDSACGSAGQSTQGQCYGTQDGNYFAAAGGQPWTSSATLLHNNAVVYGTFTGANPATLGVVTDTDGDGANDHPRYLMEVFERDNKYYYRITARAVGAQAGTVVELQEIFTP
jgi:type IV pilus assembly protein PilX